MFSLCVCMGALSARIRLQPSRKNNARMLELFGIRVNNGVDGRTRHRLVILDVVDWTLMIINYCLK